MVRRSSNTGLHDVLMAFCFPEIRSSSAIDDWIEEPLTETFSFVLTLSTGEKRWGYCKRMVISQDKKKVQSVQCFCIVSALSCFSMFEKILDHLIALPGNLNLPFFYDLAIMSNSSDANQYNYFLAEIYMQALPPPGGSLQAGILELQRPEEGSAIRDRTNFGPLLEHLDPVNIVSIFASLLIERRVIFVASRLGTLSACVQSMVSVCYLSLSLSLSLFLPFRSHSSTRTQTHNTTSHTTHTILMLTK